MNEFKKYFYKSNNIIKETRKILEYPYGPEKDNEEYYKFYDNHLWIKMSPKQFLELVPRMPEENKEDAEYNKKSFEHNKKLIINNKIKIKDPILLYVDENLGIYAHEGRHRSVALMRLGIREIPVLILYNIKNKNNLEKRKDEVFRGEFLPEFRNTTNRIIINNQITPKNIKSFEDQIENIETKYPWLEYEYKGTGSYYFYPKNNLKFDDPILKVVIRSNMFIIISDYIEHLKETRIETKNINDCLLNFDKMTNQLKKFHE